MKEYDVPTFIIVALTEGISESDYHLYGCGRAVGFVMMSADELANLGASRLKTAEYNTYAGISAARTAIDAAASWLNLQLNLGMKPGVAIDFAKDTFRNRLVKRKPCLEPFASKLGQLAKDIDQHRQRAQHREGLASVIMRRASTLAIQKAGTSHRTVYNIQLKRMCCLRNCLGDGLIK